MPTHASAHAVDVRNVWKRYAAPSGRRDASASQPDVHVAVRDLSLAIPAGAIYGLLGPNGAGKTTTIRMLLNLIVPDSGTIAVLGSAPSEPGLSDRIGYLPEERGLYRRMRVRDVLRFLAALKSIPSADAATRIEWWLDHFRLTTSEKDWGNARIDELSRGMQQKVQFIGAVLHEPELLILDEPFSGLDPVNTQILQDTMLSLRDQGTTVIFSTHIMGQAETLCDAVCIIARGEKIVDGTVSEVKTQFGGPPVERTVLVQPSLHDIFIAQVGAQEEEWHG